MGIVPAVQPQLGARRLGTRAIGPGLQPLHAGGPDRRGQAGLDGVHGQAEVERGGDRQTGIVDLVRAREVRQGQVQQPVDALEDQPPVLGEGVDVLAQD